MSPHAATLTIRAVVKNGLIQPLDPGSLLRRRIYEARLAGNGDTFQDEFRRLLWK